jgi:hypothetical protein
MPSAGIATISLIDQLGRVINTVEALSTKGYNSSQINTADYPKGIYTIIINSNGSNSGVQKIIKE